MEYSYTTSQAPDKGVQVGPEPIPTPNATLAMTQDSIPGFGGNLIEVGIITNGINRAVYMSKAYPANADGMQRPGAVVEYGSEFSIGEGIGGVEVTIPEVLPAGYIAAEFLESTGLGRMELDTTLPSTARIEMDAKFTQALSTRAFFGSEGRGTLTDTRRFCIMQLSDGTRCDYGSNIKSPSYVMPLNKKIKIIKDGALNYVDGELIATNTAQTFEGLGCVLFSRTANTSGGGAAGCIYWCNIYNNNVLECELLPAVDQLGVPCMYDKANKKSYYNLEKAALIVGFTLAQARKLSTLPATGGTLTVSLPTGYDSDPGVTSALAKAEANGWVITIQTYTPEAEAAATTFALKRVWVRKNENEQGSYVDADGKRWQVEWCVDIIGADPEQEGYEMFRSVEAATEYWGLTPYIDPEAEEEFSQEV